MTVKYLCCYIRLVVEPGKPAAIRGETVLLGTVTDSFDAAEAEARAIVARYGVNRDGTVLPRIFQMREGDEQLIDALLDAQEWFENKVKDFNEVDGIIKATSKRRRRK